MVIPERDGGSISEAQAYGLLRAVWAGDQATFGRVQAWTRRHLARPDHLLSWHWGRRPDGSWGVLDANTASTATWTTPWPWCWPPAGAGGRLRGSRII